MKKIILCGIMMIFTFTTTCYASISDSILVTGTQKLISDLMNLLIIIAPTLSALLIGYYLLRKANADDMDAKRWDNRIKVTLICCIGVVVVTSLINVIMSYYR